MSSHSRINLILSAITLTVALTANAQTAPAFDTLVEEVADRCDLPAGACRTPYAATIFQGADFREMANYPELKQAAFDRAQIWGDAILEGPYESIGNTLLDRVVAIYQNGQPVLYYINYSERAVDLTPTTCDFNDETKKWTGECIEGRIRERAAVSPDYQDATVREGDYAEFFEKEN